LHYPPFGLVVRCQSDRRRTVNRFIALRELVDQIEMKISPETSQRLREIERTRAAKSRATRRARARHRGDSC
jgi:protein subunit release factor B